MNTRIIIALLLSSITLFSCDSSVDQEPASQSDLKKVIKKADKDQYQPPVDGKLSDEQIKMYIAVRKRESEMLAGSAEKLNDRSKQANELQGLRGLVNSLDALQELATFASLDVQAAAELNYNTAEYQWAKETILDTNMSVKMADFANTTSPETLKEMERNKMEFQKAMNEAPNEEIKKELADALQNMDKQTLEINKSVSQLTNLPEHVRYNKALMDKYQQDLNVIEDEIRKWEHLENAG